MEKIKKIKNPEMRIIKQVYGDKNQRQMLVTIPNWVQHIKVGDFVEIIKVEKVSQ